MDYTGHRIIVKSKVFNRETHSSSICDGKMALAGKRKQEMEIQYKRNGKRLVRVIVGL